ncbi:hypothetical protein QFZ94_000235 [Paraburkholderia sp. JPY465]
MLMEQMRYNLLFRWFIGLAIEPRVGPLGVLEETATGCWSMKSWKRFSLKS